MKYLIVAWLLILVTISVGQVCQDAESDTATVGEYRNWLRFRLNDYHTDQTWADSVLTSYLKFS